MAICDLVQDVETIIHIVNCFMMHRSYNTFSIIQIGIWILKTCISGFEYFGMTLTSTEATLIETLLCMFGRYNIP